MLVDKWYNSRRPDEKHIWEGVESARLLWADRTRPDAGWTMYGHAHLCWEFIYFLQGSGRVTLPFGTVQPQQYHLLIYPPRLVHEESANPLDPEGTIFFLADISSSIPLDTPLLLPDGRGDMRWLCEHILAEYQSMGATALAESYLRSFLFLVERIWETGVSMKHDLVDTAVRYMNVNYFEDIDPKRLSEVCHVSEDHIARRFHAKLGVSPMHYLQNIRIEAAKRLLVTTAIPIGEIAEQIGFSDPLYFSRVFKCATGYTPSEFRSLAANR